MAIASEKDEYFLASFIGGYQLFTTGRLNI